jgi:hypothetical protein
MAIEPQETDIDPKNPSSEYRAMSSYWAMVSSIIVGVEALRAIQGYGMLPNVAGPAIPYAHLAMLNRGLLRTTSGRGSPYLPQFPNETDADYDMRRRWAPLTNIYSDISRNLASKPFSKTLALDDSTADDLKTLAENIDGQGNNLHVFAREAFKSALDYGIDWILVDYPKIQPGSTLADERSMGARPYWTHVPAHRLLAVYSDYYNGQEIITHARILESCIEREGYGEETKERVRVLNREEIEDDQGNTIGYAPATWEIFELVSNDTGSQSGTNAKANWTSVDSGDITIGIIPLVPYYSGKRRDGSWLIDPPLKDLAYMQVEEFQQESNLKTIKELTAFPMITGNGVTPPTGQDGKDVFVPVGPRSILYAPPNANGQSGSWHFIEPSGASLTFLQADLEKLRTEMRDLGMQPLATANLTVVTTANISMRAHSAVQAWALGLKDALEQAWNITCKWLNRTDFPAVNVHTDFGVDMEAGTELDVLLKAEAQGIITPETVWDEFKRRGVLSDDFDPDEEKKALDTSIDMETTTLLHAEAQGVLSKKTLWQEFKRRSVLAETFDPAEEEKQLATEQKGLVPEVAIDPVTGEIVQPSTRPHTLSQYASLPAPPPPKPTSA